MKQNTFNDRIVLTEIARWLNGNEIRFNIEASQDSLDALKKASNATKDFMNELYSPGTSVLNVMTALSKKNLATKEFEDKTGIKWPF
jgi:hypothetical protein